MSDDQRVYSDEEFALILRKAAELASLAESAGRSSSGLTMTEMKAAAANLDFERAAALRDTLKTLRNRELGLTGPTAGR